MNKWEEEENEAGKTSKAETEYQTQEKYEHYAKIRNSLRGKGETVLQKHCVDYTNIKQSVWATLSSNSNFSALQILHILKLDFEFRKIII